MAYHISHYLNNLKAKLLARGDKPEIAINSLPELNKTIWGIQRGKVYVVAARTSNCKSAFILQLALDIAKQGHPTLILSLEMDTLSILERAFSQEQQINNMDLLTGKMNLYLEQFTEFSRKAENITLTIGDSIGKTWQEIDIYLATLSVKPKVVIIDHIHEVKKSAVQDRGLIDEYIRHFKEMAIRDNFAGIVCAQINRTSQDDESKRPRLHQIKSSGYLEECCDVGILLHYPYNVKVSQDINKFVLFVDKNRNGRTGYIDLRYEPSTYTFTDSLAKPKEEQKTFTRKDWTEEE